MKIVLKIITSLTLICTLLIGVRIYSAIEIYLETKSLPDSVYHQYGEPVWKIKETFGEVILVLALAFVLGLQVTLLLIKCLKKYDSYKDDLLIYKPYSFKDSHLGFRRVLSIFFNIIILFQIIAMLFVCIGGGAGYNNDFPILLLVLILGFWGIWFILSVFNWIILGFQRK